MIDWSSVQALTFDCFGTLIDWETGILRDLRVGLSTDAPDERLLGAYAEAESALEVGAFRPYRDVLREALARVGASLGAPVRDPEALVRGLPSWPAFADTREALGTLGRRYKLCIASNVDRDLFEGTAAVLGVRLDEIVTADQVRSYKPAPAHLEEAMRRLGVGRDGLVHVAQSLYHDIEPALAMGLTTVWVDRRGGRPGGATKAPAGAPSPHLTVRSLAALATAAVPA